VRDPVAVLQDGGHRVYYANFTALDRYFRLPPSPGTRYCLTDCSLICLARTFDELEYAGDQHEDAIVTWEGRQYAFRCYDEDDPPSARPFSVQELLYDPGRDVFLDPEGVYPDLRLASLAPRGGAPPLVRLGEAAKLVSRYHYQVRVEELGLEGPLTRPAEAFQRDLLLGVLEGSAPQKGLALLYESGFVRAFWPELARMTGIPHVKDYHPEGDGWAHTLETLKHRKQAGAVLSLALLLHDVGKPDAPATQERPYDRHAELGAEVAASLLRRLGFAQGLIQEVSFLVRYHMMPAALKKLPLFRSEKVMDSPLFPQLLELYRADLSASYWSPESYYEACQVYRTYLKNKANPYRRRDGSKQRWQRSQRWQHQG
jgi:poly(A) polymerase